MTLASNTTATNSTTPSVVSSKITDVTSKTGSERANKKAIKKDDQYQWLKKFVSEEEKKMKRKEKREQEAKKAQMGKVLNSTLLDQMVAAQQAKLQEEKAKSEKNSGSFNIYKVDNSWSAYFLSFFGQPTKTQLDPENVLTKALINSMFSSSLLFLFCFVIYDIIYFYKIFPPFSFKNNCVCVCVCCTYKFITDNTYKYIYIYIYIYIFIFIFTCACDIRN